MNNVIDFHQGDKLRLKVGGTASRVVVRLLQKGTSPDDPVGVDGGVVRVPTSKEVELELQGNHADVIQVSVLGGVDPFGLYPLGGGNGPATLLSAEVCAR